MERGFRIAIDAASIRTGGGLWHLTQLLSAAEPANAGIESITVFSSGAVLSRLPAKSWLRRRALRLPRAPSMIQLAVTSACAWQFNAFDVVLAPAGWSFAPGHRIVAMAQNMLVFDSEERQRYQGTARLKLRALHYLQRRTIESAAALIVHSQVSSDLVSQSLRKPVFTKVIPHGVEEEFVIQRSVRASASAADPWRLIYLSTVDLYKHQWLVAEAVSRLRLKGLPVRMDFVGSAYPPALARLKQTILRLDPAGEYLRYLGPVPQLEIPNVLRNVDVFVFASTCEAFSLSLLQGMAAGCPIVCANRGAMVEVAGDAAHYVAVDVSTLAAGIEFLINTQARRKELSEKATLRAREFTWTRAAESTMNLLGRVARSLTESPSLVQSDQEAQGVLEFSKFSDPPERNQPRLESEMNSRETVQ